MWQVGVLDLIDPDAFVFVDTDVTNTILYLNQDCYNKCKF